MAHNTGPFSVLLPNGRSRTIAVLGRRTLTERIELLEERVRLLETELQDTATNPANGAMEPLLMALAKKMNEE